MKTSSHSNLSSRHRWALAMMGAIIIALAAATLFGPAGAQNQREDGILNPAPDYDVDHPSVLTDEGAWTGPGEWPPRPKGTSPSLITEPAPDEGRRPAERAATQKTDQVAEALGDRFSLIGSNNPFSDDPNVAKETIDPSRIHSYYFSHANNQTVFVETTNGAITRVETTPPTEGQPALSGEEREAAVALATQHWSEQGFGQAEQLTGFAIRALQADGSEYDVRMAYVSFHDGIEGDPELLTWIDLTNLVTFKAEVQK